MNRSEVETLLNLAALYDRRSVEDTDVMAWMPLMAEVAFAQAQSAVFAHFRECRYWLTPDDVLRRIREERSKRITESGYKYITPDPDEPPEAYLRRYRAQLAAVADGQPIPAEAQALKRRPVAELISGIAAKTVIPGEVREVLKLRRHPAGDITCPACRTPAGDPCVTGSGGSLEARYHPSRLDAWAVVTSPCPECRVAIGEGCTEMGRPYPHGVHRNRLKIAQETL